MVQLYKSMLTLAFHALLRPGEFSYSSHVVRIEHVFVDNMGVTIYLTSSKTHQFPFCQRVRVAPQCHHCPVCYLLNYLAIRPIETGALYVGPNNLPVQYPAALSLFDKLAEFIDLPPGGTSHTHSTLGQQQNCMLKDFPMKLPSKEAGGLPMPFKNTFVLYNYRKRSCVVTWGSTFAALNSQVS